MTQFEKHSQKSHTKDIEWADLVHHDSMRPVEPSYPRESKECWANPFCGNTSTRRCHSVETGAASRKCHSKKPVGFDEPTTGAFGEVDVKHIRFGKTKSKILDG